VNYSKGRLVSASSDQTVRVWDLGQAECLQVVECKSIPTCTTFVSEGTQFLVGFVDGLGLYDTESGKEIWKVEDSAINQVVIHPTLPVAVSGHQDKYVKFWDLKTGKCTSQVIGHAESVTSLSFDPNGLALVTGGHDSSLKMWDVSTKGCIQEISCRMIKHDESILCVAHHKLQQFVAVGGADGVVKIFE
jgi:striatin 1/3/4